MISSNLFAKKLLKWSQLNPRDYPWIGEKDPYKIWISEIILQQTRSNQGRDYYLNFLKHFPDVYHLAGAKEDEVLNVWKGLGYYSRARNLHETAKTIITQWKGKFPSSVEEMKSLKGIGDYSAAAICSFAYNSPVAVVDGNVIRVLSRLFGNDSNPLKAEGKKWFLQTAHYLLDKTRPALYNQAIMNFGAIQCKPTNPLCFSCPFSEHCLAYQENQIPRFPYKIKKKAVRSRFFHYFLIQNTKGEIAVQQRINKDIWQRLFELPGLESSVNRTFLNTNQLIEPLNAMTFLANKKLNFMSEETQLLSHQHITGRFYNISLKYVDFKIKPEICFVKPENLVNFAFPKIIRVFLEKVKPEMVC